MRRTFREKGYALAGGGQMKIDVKQIKSEEALEFHGNKLFTQEQLDEIGGA